MLLLPAGGQQSANPAAMGTVGVWAYGKKAAVHGAGRGQAGRCVFLTGAGVVVVASVCLAQRRCVACCCYVYRWGLVLCAKRADGEPANCVAGGVMGAASAAPGLL